MSEDPTRLADRIAGAPASWGICEVPGWGFQLPPMRVLAEMRDVGLHATELGPEGFLPGSPEQQAAFLAPFGLRAVAEFCPLVLHDRFEVLESQVTAILDKLTTVGADTMVIAAATGVDGYDDRPELDEPHWQVLLRNLERIVAMANEREITGCLHPHVGTQIETYDDVRRVLDDCDVPLCVDTGHLLVGGTDPVALVREVPERIAHMHLKDVDDAVLATVRSGRRTYTEGVRNGMYTVLGKGGIDLPATMTCLEMDGYQGWYVFEQDRVLVGEPDDEGGPLADIRASVEYLRGLATSIDRLIPAENR